MYPILVSEKISTLATPIVARKALHISYDGTFLYLVSLSGVPRNQLMHTHEKLPRHYGEFSFSEGGGRLERREWSVSLYSFSSDRQCPLILGPDRGLIDTGHVVGNQDTVRQALFLTLQDN
jgi:hypothetical protein